MKKFKRIFVIVMDSFGAGHAKDGAAYGDDGADTMGHIAEKHDNWKIPNLTRLGLANLHPLKGVTLREGTDVAIIATGLCVADSARSGSS